jgi:pyridoxine kinase
MARILAISSQVVRGHVGLSAAVPALQSLGHDVWPLPTVLLSNHPGHAPPAGTRIDAATLDAIVRALDAKGWLDEVDAVLTGYLPSAEHVASAVATVERLRRRRPHTLMLCDPVLGDDPMGLYIDPAAAAAVRDRLLPLADVATPNRMELSFLTSRPVRDPDQAARALECLACGGGVATSIAAGDGLIANVLSLGRELAIARVPLRPSAPHGTGDLFAALVLGHVLAGSDIGRAVACATAGVDVALAASTGADELQLADSLADLRAAEPWPIVNLRLGT